MINSLLAHYDQSADHLLSVWSLQGNETWCMIGYHAVPVIVDGYLKGVKGIDRERAYQAIRTTAMNPRLRWCRRLCQTGLGPLRPGKRVRLQDPRICLRRLLRSADGPGTGEEGRLRILHEADGQLQERLRSLHQPSPGKRLARQVALPLRPPRLRRGLPPGLPTLMQ
jgi:hypothetical protein